MRIYLDTKDLIDLLERSQPMTAEAFSACLCSNGHRVVVSFHTVAELAAPLLTQSAQTNVMALLNCLEHLPVTFIADVRISLLELREALSACAEGREYQPIDPFVGRFDETIAVEGMLSSRFLFNFGIAETVFLLWTNDPKIFDAYHRDVPKLRQVVSTDRALTRPPTLSAHFSEAITRDLTLYSLPIPPGGVEAFATGIYAVPWRCPSQRLSYELYHSLRMNRGDRPKPSDFGDLYHSWFAHF